MKKLFLNFYSLENSSNQMFILENGFSRVHNLCKDNSISFRLNWLLPKSMLNELYRIIENKYDIVYMSAWWWDMIFLIYILAKRIPNTKFVVGGPACKWLINRFGKDKVPLLPNLEITDKNLDYIFSNYKDREWGLPIPNTFSENATFSFCLGPYRGCYWKKCNFCDGYNEMNINEPTDIYFIDKIPDKIRDKYLNVQYTVSEARPKDLESWLPALNSAKNLNHTFFWRADSRYLDGLKRVLDKCKYPENLSFFMGLEFLTDRMLSYINKGLTSEDYIKTIDVLVEYNCKPLTTMILGWNNLTEEDIEEFSNNIDKLKNPKKLKIKVRRLKVSYFTEPNFGDVFNGCEKQYFPLFLPEIKDRPEIWKNPYMFQYLIGSHQRKLNEDVLKMLQSKNFETPILDEYSMSLTKNDIFAGKTILSRAIIGGNLI